MVAIVGQATTRYVNLRRDKWLPLSGKQQRVALQYLTRNEKLRQHREGRMQAAMAKKKRHSRVEIATKLAQATDLATQGKSQREIAHTLGVSVMTLHRWRKVPPGPQTAFVATHEARRGDRIAELQLENLRLRRLVTDLLLEKIRLEEAAQTSNAPMLTLRRTESNAPEPWACATPANYQSSLTVPRKAARE
jgi:DNA-binding transcriptional regulator YiaG